MLLLDNLAVIFTCKLHILFIKMWVTVVVSSGFYSASALVKVAVNMIETDGSAGRHVVI